MLEWKIDEMTDRKRCAVFTPTRAIYASIQADEIVSFWIPDGASLASAQMPALVRIDSNAPFNLVVSDTPRLLDVPKNRSRQTVEALYRRSKIVVRFYTFPSRDERTVQLIIGDVASAYEYAVTNCGWKRLNIERTPLPKEPDVHKADNGYVFATFGGEAGWTVSLLSKDQSCRLSTSYSRTIFSSRNGSSEYITPLGAIMFHRADGNVTRTLMHDSFSDAPIAEFMKAAEETGEYGYVHIKNEAPTSVYGLAEALRYIEQICGVTLR